MTPHTFSTPMMQQYASIKEHYPDCLLFFRLGDFYELFMDDAKKGAEILDITLTKRPRGKDGHIPMAGVPYHVADIYIGRLVKAGVKVAICEQVSEPDGKGIVDRKVVRVVTPGTLLDERSLDKREFNFITSIALGDSEIGFASADLSTGDFKTTQIKRTGTLNTLIKDELARFNPTEVILEEASYNDPTVLKIVSSVKGLNVYSISSDSVSPDIIDEHLRKHFKVIDLKVFGIDSKILAQRASFHLLTYLEKTQQSKLIHIRKISTYEPQESVILDASTIKNLELFETIHERKKTHTLVSLLDKTHTAMGARMLREWIRSPLLKKEDIEKRLNAVNYLYHNLDDVDRLNSHFDHIYDVLRIISRLSVGVGNPVDIVHLKESLSEFLEIKKSISAFKIPLFTQATKAIPSEITSIVALIDKILVDDPPFDPKIGGLIKKSVDKKLDNHREKIKGSKTWIAELEEKERARSGISSLKVSYNTVFGFYIEVSKSNSTSVPSHYIRKQTLVNAERYITDELKKHEDRVLSAEATINELEYSLFLDLIERILEHVDSIQKASETIATLDVITAFAQVAHLHKYTLPTLTNDRELSIIQGRHPVVADILQSEFVPNTITLGGTSPAIALITGPNMAGKSVFIRQVALITLLAHIGMFVPAEEARVSIVDRIFVRSGASDVISDGLSTFMLEMIETAHILNNATPESLIVMDEVGRGTSTYDGISIAWGIVEYLVNNLNKSVKTLFATHYHELTELEEQYPEQIINYSLSVDEEHGQPFFLYTLTKGPAPTSFGIQVAELAGIPHQVIARAKYKLSALEKKHHHKNHQTSKTDQSLKSILASLDIESTTPLEALKILDTLARTIK